MEYSSDEIRAKLDHILSSDQFKNSLRLSTFLSFVVNQTLIGKGSRLKAFTIAVEAFGRDPSLDSQDPYVRNIAGNVRRSLSAYYEQNPSDLYIRIPVGTYVPEFSTKSLPRTGTDDASPYSVSYRDKPTVAIIPLHEFGNGNAHGYIGEVFVDDLINRFSRYQSLNVISRLSTTAFLQTRFDLTAVKESLNADYVISGSFTLSSARVKLNIELADTHSGYVVYSEQINTSLKSLLQIERGLIIAIAENLSGSINKNEVERGFNNNPMTLENYTLMISSIHLLHRIVPLDFNKAKEFLDILMDRKTRSPLPYAWAAKWHVLNHVQGNAKDTSLLREQATRCTEKALELDSRCALALTIDGLVQTNILKQLTVAEERYNDAIESNPSDSLARLLRGTLFAFKGQGKQAMEDVRKAMTLSPLDPMKYYYLSLSSTAALAAKEYDSALSYASESLKLNRHHASTLRAAAIAHINLDQQKAAKTKVEQLLRVDPDFTIKRFMAESPSAAYDTGKHWADSLSRAGVP